MDAGKTPRIHFITRHSIGCGIPSTAVAETKRIDSALQKIRVWNYRSVSYRLYHVKVYTKFGWVVHATEVAVVAKDPGSEGTKLQIADEFPKSLCNFYSHGPIKATRFIDGFVLTLTLVLRFDTPSGIFQRNFLQYPKMPVSTRHGRFPSWARACL